MAYLHGTFGLYVNVSKMMFELYVDYFIQWHWALYIRNKMENIIENSVELEAVSAVRLCSLHTLRCLSPY